MRYCNPIVLRAKKPENEDLSSISFVSAVSLGGLTKPDDLILNMVHNMENEFFKIHGKGFTKQPNIRLNLISEIKQKCPEIPQDIVNLFARSRIYFRCNYLNKLAQDNAIKERIERRNLKAKAIEEAKAKELEAAKAKEVEATKAKEDESSKTKLSGNVIRPIRKRLANLNVNENDDPSTTSKKRRRTIARRVVRKLQM